MKQETLEEAANKTYCFYGDVELREAFELGAKWQQEQHKITIDDAYNEGFENGKHFEQERTYSEEAAQKRFPINHNLSILERMGLNSAANMGFIEGAKWQQERSYSEEEVFELLENLVETFNPPTDNLKKWFEQFKK